MGLDNLLKKMIGSNVLDYREGYYEFLGIRGVVFPIPTFSCLLEEIHEAEGEEGLFEAIFHMGHKHGKTAVEDVGRQNEASKQEFISQLIRTGNVMGFGKVQVINSEISEGVLEIELEDSPLEDSLDEFMDLDELDRPIHEFWRGVFHSICEALFESEVESREEECQFLGDEHCLLMFKEVKE